MHRKESILFEIYCQSEEAEITEGESFMFHIVFRCEFDNPT